MDHNGISTTTGGGIVVVPGAAGSANVQITNTKLVDNSVGLDLLSIGPMFVAVQGGMVATNNGDGIRAVATAVLNLTITRTSIVNNFGTGVLASGALATVRVGGATIYSNTTGVSFAGATMQSFKKDADPALFQPWRQGSTVNPRLKVLLWPFGQSARKLNLLSARPARPALGTRSRTWSTFSRPSCALAAKREGATTLDRYLRRLRGACGHPQRFAESF
jgi:hypothetical protein